MLEHQEIETLTRLGFCELCVISIAIPALSVWPILEELMLNVLIPEFQAEL